MKKQLWTEHVFNLQRCAAALPMMHRSVHTFEDTESETVFRIAIVSVRLGGS